MLELYERHSPPADGELIQDPEAAFLMLRVTRSDLTETLMREIDKAKYVNEVLTRCCSKGDQAGNQAPEARHGSTLGAG